MLTIKIANSREHRVIIMLTIKYNSEIANDIYLFSLCLT